jgi:uncharacterized protein YjiS (DUF1127 family)
MDSLLRRTCATTGAIDRTRAARPADPPRMRDAAASWIARALAAWARRRRVAAGIAAMRELDDRALHDLGVDRAGIGAAAAHGRR